MKHRAAALAFALALAACGDRQSGAVISREQFIRASVAVRTVPDSAAGADSLRARALRREKVTPAQLRAWVRVHERDGKLMAETWREIVRRVDAAAPKPTPGPPAGVAPPASSPPELARVPPPPPSTPPPMATPAAATDGQPRKTPKRGSREMVREAPSVPMPAPGAPDVTRPAGPPVPDSAGRPRG